MIRNIDLEQATIAAFARFDIHQHPNFGMNQTLSTNSTVVVGACAFGAEDELLRSITNAVLGEVGRVGRRGGNRRRRRRRKERLRHPRRWWRRRGTSFAAVISELIFDHRRHSRRKRCQGRLGGAVTGKGFQLQGPQRFQTGLLDGLAAEARATSPDSEAIRSSVRSATTTTTDTNGHLLFFTVNWSGFCVKPDYLAIGRRR